MINSATHPAARQRSVLAFLLLFGAGLLVPAGCSSSKTEEGKTVKSPEQQAADAEKAAAEKKAAVKPAAPTPAELWVKQVAKVEALIKADKLEEADAALKEFDLIYPATAPAPAPGEKTAEPAKTPVDPSKAPADPKAPAAQKVAGPSEAELTKVAGLKASIFARRAELASLERVEKLAAAQDAFAKQDYNAAADAVNRVLAISPTDEQRQQATTLRVEIERIQGRQRELRGLIRMLGSSDKNQVTSANSQLAAEPDVSLSLLLEAVKEKDQPVLVKNALELMRRMKRPDVAMPAMVGVLAREEQKESWPDAVREISRLNEPGAGKPLLDLVLSSKNPEQRAAALESLVAVVDPPAETQIALLPLLESDGPDLTVALRAIHHAVRVNGLQDADTERNLETEFTPEQKAQLAALPARLEKLMAGSADPATAPAAYEAKVLALATRRQDPQVLTGVKVFGFSSEVEDGPAAAVLDGVWNSIDLKTQWRHPVADSKSIVLDLGTERTVVGIRVWNFNEPATSHRGWRVANVFVSDTPRALVPVTSGVIPMAPGAADTPDYSTFIPVDFARGRYVKLQAESVWKEDVYTGLAEIQVIGF